MKDVKIIPLAKFANKTFLLRLFIHEDGHFTCDFVICTDFNPKARYGEMWIWGHYFDDVLSASKYWCNDVVHIL